MPAPMYIPKRQNPFASMMPKMFMNVMMQNYQRKMQKEDYEDRLRQEQEYAEKAVPKVMKIKGGGRLISYMGKTQYIDEKTAKLSQIDEIQKLVQKGDLTTQEGMKAIRVNLGLEPKAGTAKDKNREEYDDFVTAYKEKYPKASLMDISKAWEERKKRVATAGRTIISPTLELQKEKYAMQKNITISQYRKSLTDNRHDKEFFQANAPIFNKNNEGNEVAYWDEDRPGMFNRDQATIIKVPPKFKNAGWTPDKIQEVADKTGLSVKELLQDIGIIR